MGADSTQRQRRHAKKLERLRRRKAERRPQDAQAGSSHLPLPDPALEVEDDGPVGFPERKLSDILLELVQPFFSEQVTPTLPELQKALRLAATVWNAVNLEQVGMPAWNRLTAAFDGLDSEARAIMLTLVETMRDWKLDWYPLDRRPIRDATVIADGDGFRVLVET